MSGKGKDRVAWLCVGTGDIVKKRAAAALAQAPRGALAGVCGGAERAAEIAKDHGAPETHADLDQALAETLADAVYIGTPVHRHRTEALRAIKAGKHVLVEKPLGLDAEDARAIAAAAREAGVTAACAYYRRAFPRYAHLKKLLADQTLGRIVMVRTAYWGWFAPAADDPKRWRVDKALGGGGPLADMGTHMFDLLIGLFGMPESVFANCSTLAQDYTVEDTATAIFTLPGGAQSVATFGWNSKTWTHEFEVIGTEGKVLWRPADAGGVVVTIGREVETLDLPGAENVHLPLVADFNEAVLDQRAPLCPLDEAVKTNVLLDAIYESAATNRPVAPAESP